MIHIFLMLCAFAEGFLLWFLVALNREIRLGAPHTENAGRTRCGSVSRGENGAEGAGFDDQWADVVDRPQNTVLVVKLSLIHI